MIKFAVFSDLHYDFIPDGDTRLNELLKASQANSVEFVMNLGDFCIPIAKNRAVLDKLESSNVPCFHALGNHDSDFYEKEQIVDFLKLKKSYYSFHYNNIKFIVLDSCFTEVNHTFYAYNRNHFKESKGHYPIIPSDQLDWLQSELEEDYAQYIIFSHHSLDNDFGNRGIHNRNSLHQLFRNYPTKKITCFNGHDHSDSHTVIDKRSYIGINAMSYIWLGELCHLKPYSDEMYKKYPLLNDILLYDQALFAIVTIDDQGQILIKGKHGGYRHITPKDLDVGDYWNGRKLSCQVSNFHLK